MPKKPSIWLVVIALSSAVHILTEVVRHEPVISEVLGGDLIMPRVVSDQAGFLGDVGLQDWPQILGRDRAVEHHRG